MNNNRSKVCNPKYGQLKIPNLLLIALLCGHAYICPPSHADETKNNNSQCQQTPARNGTKAKIIIKAPLAIVWKSVETVRAKDPERRSRKLIKETPDGKIVEEDFEIPSVLGTANCKLNLTEVPFKRIDYHLAQSEDFKAMEGSWVLTPSEDGQSTTVELSSYLELGMPFPRFVVNGIVKHKLESRLDAVKHVASELCMGNTKTPIVQKPN